MMEVHTLGDTLIKVGEKEIRPTSPLLFAALLYLGVERGRRVPRAALQELLFPNASERSGAHSLRQLLYKLRQLGAPIEADAACVTATAASIEVDVLALESGRGDVIDRLLDSPSVLPRYEPSISEGFASWLDDFSERAQSRVVARLTTLLGQSRDAADRSAVERAADALLKIDPFNEAATIARAEVLALTGQKKAAVRLLESFASEVGQTASTLRVPADVLRRRIEDRLDAVERNRVPLIGRDKELALMLAQFTRSQEGQPTVSVIWGDAGIGKTRLVEELSAHLLLKRASVETVLCQPHDAGRPLGALIDVVPKLVNARGALGVAPESLETLKRLSGDASASVEAAEVADPDYGTARIRTAITDLLLSIAGERSLILLVEDAHWLDADSVRLLTRFLPTQRARLHIVLTFRGRPALLEEKRLSDRVFVRQLEALDTRASQALLGHTLGDEVVIEPGTQSDCVALADGNPLFLCTIAEHLRLRGGVLPARTELSELLKQRLRILPAQSLLLMRALAALGTYGTAGRLVQATGLAEDAAILALQDVADRGLVSGHDGLIRCSHDLLAEVVISDMPNAMRGIVFERVATVLEHDGREGRHLGMLHASAECWRNAGNKDRALQVLKHCVAYANEMGQSAVAAQILDESQPLATEKELLPLIQETIRAAHQAHHHAILVANVDRYAEILKARDEPLPDNHEFRILRVNASHYLGESAESSVEMLVDTANDASQPINARVLAARTILVESMQQLDTAMALRIQPVLDDLVSRSDNSVGAREVRLIYNTYFGSLDHAETEAHDLLSSECPLSAVVLGNVARAFQYAGSLDSARYVFESALADTEGRGLHHQAARLCGQFAGFIAAVGTPLSAKEWLERGERHLELAGPRYGAVILYYRAVLSLRERDIRRARLTIAPLISHNEASSFQGRRAIKGLELLIDHVDFGLRAEAIDFEQLQAIDVRGRRLAEHGVFALAYYVANSVAGKHQHAARCVRDYLTSYQRERYSVIPWFTSFPIEESIRERLLADIGDLVRPVASFASQTTGIQAASATSTRRR